jgi:penicillin-binding protein 1A
MGIRTPVSDNLAMTLGGLKQGVTPLDMAHAYETIATGGNRVYGTLGAPNARTPVGASARPRAQGDRMRSRRNKNARSARA